MGRRKKRTRPQPPSNVEKLQIPNEELRDKGWEVIENFSGARKKGFVWFSPEPERKRFVSAKAVSDHLRSVASSCSEESTEDEEYVPSLEDYESSHSSPEKKRKPNSSTVVEIDVPNFLFVGMTHQTLNMVEEVNLKFECRSCKDAGRLVPVYYKVTGLGGAAELSFQCIGCAATIHYGSSSVSLLEYRRNSVSLALVLAFFIWGGGYASYYNVLRKGLGIQCLTDKPFYRVIELSYPKIKHILDDACDQAKEEMKAKPEEELGSWKKAVTTSDGCWLIRGFHSQCATFVVINFITQGLLYYGHLCMRGANDISDSDLWQGTSKSAEGHLSYLLFAQAKDEGMVVSINWQDADSTSQKSFREIFPDNNLSRVMLCGGHVGRSHSNNIKEYKSRKHVESGYIDKHKKNFPAIASVKCHCEKNHSSKCGCITEEFITSAKRNHFCVLKQSKNDPSEYADRMMKLGKHHARDIHEWVNEYGEREECGFHPLVVCSCGQCKGHTKKVESSGAKDADEEGIESGQEESDDSDDEENGESDEHVELGCEGKKYKTRTILSCPMHSLVYEIECKRVGDKAEQVIDRDMGRGHSNLPESRFSVLAKFRGKSINLHQLHYEAITNVGLLQGNTTYTFKTKGPEYHWALDLYSAMGLPIPEGLAEQLKDDNSRRFQRLEKMKSAKLKLQRVHRKKSRAEEQAKRKRYVKQQKIVHTYGEVIDDVVVDDDEERLEMARSMLNQGESAPAEIASVQAPSNSNVRLGGHLKEGGRTCKCGSTGHKRTSHKDCPLNKKKSQ